ncbi:MAG: T9SS type A sorting domain-containing protein [Bacteroidetes bacterium]|nr:T9SS type A sorting domain-containing protein [Bacteroidota bacterium]
MKKSLLISLLTVILFSSYSYSQIKKVLFEEFTNASCGPCAANNPSLKSFLDSKGDTIVAVKYHTEFPGFDPMYNLNPSQVNERRTGYYSDVNAVPWLKGDGNMFPDIWPFTIGNFNTAFDTRKVLIPPLTISVTDTRISGDSVEALVMVNIQQDLPAGDYKLRVMAVEKVIEYPTPPGNNGERIFEHVFRLGMPDMTGTQLATSAGNYQYRFKYKLRPDWVDSNIVTTAFIQNDAGNKEVINCNVAGDFPTGINNNYSVVPGNFRLYQNYPNPFNPSTVIKFDIPEGSNVKLVVYSSLGKEAAVLINNFLNQGSYDFDFNAAGLASGFYFVKLTAGSFSDTKKITLIR